MKLPEKGPDLGLPDVNLFRNMRVTDLMPETKQRYIVSSLMEEAIASSQIEGAETTRPIAKEMLRKNLKPQDRSQQMILNNYKMILTIRETIDQPMSVSLLHDFIRKSIFFTTEAQRHRVFLLINLKSFLCVSCASVVNLHSSL